MYFKLALKNVKKSFRDFLIYFLTLAFAVCLFYTFNSFQSQQAVMEMNDRQSVLVEQLSVLMSALSVFVAIILAFLILYANNFLIKRRKKEFGLYTLLGMPKFLISKILIYETFIIGVSSLLVGMGLGILLSQALTVVTAGLFEVTLHYSFVFSLYATLVTIISFGVIFIISMLLNSFLLSRYKLIDLIHADQKNESLKIKKVWLNAIFFILSILSLGFAYYISLDKGAEALNYLIPIIIAGCIGTFLFFLSLAGFLLTITRSCKRVYFKNLNCFILRQINSNINSNFLSMSFVCIMLLLSIGALSTGLSLNSTINETIKLSTPYDYTYVVEYYTAYSPDKNNNLPLNAESLLEDLQIDKQYIKEENIEKSYVADIRLNDPSIIDHIQDEFFKSQMATRNNTRIRAIPLSVYNQELCVRGYDPISLNKDEIFIFTNTEMMKPIVQDVIDAKPEITLFGKTLKTANDSYDGIPIGTTAAINNDMLALVVDDSNIPKDTEVFDIYWNVNHSDSISDEDFANMVEKQVLKVNETLDEGIFFQIVGCMNTKDDVYSSSKGLSVILTYIGIYLGIVFMIASAVILALQQLSQASDNKRRYTILSKIGVDKRMMNRSIFSQIGIYFLCPLVLAIVHSVVGIKVVSYVVVMMGRADIFLSSIVTGGIILVIYGSYFLVTYVGYKNIIKN
ncbi:ABC transporter permease [Amedibacillus sp. YH-ame6]